jgi:hypothetical protein
VIIAGLPACDRLWAHTDPDEHARALPPPAVPLRSPPREPPPPPVGVFGWASGWGVEESAARSHGRLEGLTLASGGRRELGELGGLVGRERVEVRLEDGLALGPERPVLVEVRLEECLAPRPVLVIVVVVVVVRVGQSRPVGPEVLGHGLGHRRYGTGLVVADPEAVGRQALVIHRGVGAQVAL